LRWIYPGAVEWTERLLRSLDDVVLASAGRVYLAKDARLGRDSVEAMYPELAAWQTIRDRVDPTGRFSSDLGRRLGLTH
jgi:decaprenylphospho-beta-D-ribofuranose 2-oxidase